MADRPMLFSAPMVRALLAGRKTQTRRVFKPANAAALSFVVPIDEPPKPGWFGDEEGELQFFSGYAPGDRIWVKETWTARMTGGWTIADARRRMFNEEILYRADGDERIDGWWPSLFLPREFSRLTLTVTDVRVERLQDISSKDAIAEGIERDSASYQWRDYTGRFKQCFSARESYCSLWQSLHGLDAWTANPWVVALTFTVDPRNIDA